MRSCNQLTAKVSRIKNGRTFVAVCAPDKCEGCKACSVGRLNKSTEIPAINDVGANVGDDVAVELSLPTNFATLALVVFPLVFFVAGIVIALCCGLGELVAGGIAVGAAAIAFVVTLVFDRMVIGKKYAARITAILPEEESTESATL